MKRIKLILFTILISTIIFAQPKGNLVIIGGGSIPENIIEKYVELAGGNNSKFLIIPLASGVPVESANSFAKRLKNIGCSNIEFIFGDNTTVDSDSNLLKVENVKGVYFTGGDQSRLTKALLGSKLLERIKEIYNKGGVIAGTSAGAAVMSSVMITGEELINKDTVNVFNSITKGNIKTAEGFGLIKNAIVDQHFLKRKRTNRLISIVLEKPNLIGIGIDESTAIIANPDNSFEVLGESLVTIFDARNSTDISTDKSGHQSAKNIKMHLLKNGDKYSFSIKSELRKAKRK